MLSVACTLLLAGTGCATKTTDTGSSSPPTTTATTSTTTTTTTTTLPPTTTTTATTTTTPDNCDPSYPTKCLHDGIGDYDCAGGSGNGPNYVDGPIKVLAPDPFGLDSDGDGVGCQ
jgi:hypothetical protein